MAQLELKALIIVGESIFPSVRPSSHQVSALALLPWRRRRCGRAANALLSVFLHQKKAEEAHRILEGLGPRVELVSEDLNSFFSVF